ncbi:MAG: TetR/AcrR family transcriptional regulator [Dehalococcoidia bacterium]
MANEDRRARVVAIARGLLARGAVPTAETVAAAAGISRASYYRLAGGSHQALLREAGYVAAPSARERVLAAAAELLDEPGITGLLMDMVAERAGVSRPTLYRLFPGKAELIAAVTQTRSPLVQLGAVLSQVADHPPEEVLPRLITAAVPRLLANRGILRAVLAELAVVGPSGVVGRTVLSEMFQSLAEYLEGHMAAGRLRRTEPVAAAQALLGPLFLYAATRPDLWLERAGAAPPPEQTLTEIVQIWLRGMRPDPDDAP